MADTNYYCNLKPDARTMRPVSDDNDYVAAGGRCEQRMFAIKFPTNLGSLPNVG